MSSASVPLRSSNELGLPEVPLLAGTLVIGDLHLDVANPEHVDSFCRRMRSYAGVPRLVILGDLFEYWVGPAQIESAAPVIDMMRELVDGGTAVDVIPGNRDFLLEETFEKCTGARLRPDGMVGLLSSGADAERRILLIHGDELCTLDLPYQRMRRVLRSRPMRFLAVSIPAPISRWIAGRLRRASAKATEYKPNASMEQQGSACVEFAARVSCRALVCGHAHRFRDQRLDDGLRWWVVDAFGGDRDTLRVSDANVLELASPRCSA